MKNELKKIINKLENNVLSIGLDSNLCEELNNNIKINNLDVIDFVSKRVGRKNILKRKDKSKKINIKKLKKIYKKKSVDYIICNYDVIKKYIRYFIKDSIYMNNNTLYFYGTDVKIVNDIEKKYKRYNVNIKTKIYSNYFIIEIDNSKSKNHFIKDKLYFIYDTISLISDYIENFLIN